MSDYIQLDPEKQPRLVPGLPGKPGIRFGGDAGRRIKAFSAMRNKSLTCDKCCRSCNFRFGDGMQGCEACDLADQV